MIDNDGIVVGIEHIDELAQLSTENLNKNHSEELETGKIKIVIGDGREGYLENAPYDVIHVGAAASEVPKALIEQLAVGGAMVIPVGKEYSIQSIYLIKKLSDDEI